MNEKTLKELEARLKEEKQEIREKLERFAKEDDKPEGDWDANYPEMGDNLEESADEVEEYASLLPIEHTLESKLKNINEALERIKKGDYGKCESCKREISEKRLRLIPETSFCKDCN